MDIRLFPNVVEEKKIDPINGFRQERLQRLDQVVIKVDNVNDLMNLYRRMKEVTGDTSLEIDASTVDGDIGVYNNYIAYVCLRHVRKGLEIEGDPEFNKIIINLDKIDPLDRSTIFKVKDVIKQIEDLDPV